MEGTVTSITPNEVQVDIGTKHTGFVKVSELTDDPNAKAEDLVKVGDKLTSSSKKSTIRKALPTCPASAWKP